MKFNLLSRPGASCMSWQCIVHSSPTVIILPPQDKALTVLQLRNHVDPSICSSASGAWLSEQTRMQGHWWTCVSTSTAEENLQTLSFKAIAVLLLYYTHTYIFITCWNAVFSCFSLECTYQNLLKGWSNFWYAEDWMWMSSWWIDCRPACFFIVYK